MILTLAVIQGHTDLNHENNKCLITSETAHSMSIMFAVKIARLKVYIIFSQPDDLITSTQGHNCVSNLTLFEPVV